MNYILEVYSDGMFIPITGTAIVEDNNALTLEFGIDDYFNNPDWMTTNIYTINTRSYTDASAQNAMNGKIDTFLSDAQRDILTHLDRTGFLVTD